MAVIGKYKNNNNNKLINPIFTFKYIDEDMKNIYKMINIKENKIIAASQKNIYLFKYIIDEKNIGIELIKSHEFYDSRDIFIFEKNKIEIIALYSKYKLFLYKFPNFEIIYEKNVNKINKNNLIQINSNELLISEGNSFNIFDIRKLRINLKVKYSNNVDFLFNLNDGTIIKSYNLGITRFYLKTMKEILFINNDESEDCYEYFKNTNEIEKIVFIYKLSNKRIIVCYQNEKIELCNLKFI